MNLIEQAKAAAEAGKLDDQTEDKGGFEYVPPPAGPALARFIDYIEIGNQKQEYNGTAKAPAPEAIIVFELLGPRHAKEIEIKDEAGNVTKKTIQNRITIGRSSAKDIGKPSKSGHSMPGGNKSNHYKLLQAMDYGRGITNIAVMLGECFLVEITHTESVKTVNGKEVKSVYANLRDKVKGWQISAPVKQAVDDLGQPVGDPQPIKSPPMTTEPRLLLWQSPSIEQWKSIYIDGTYTKKVKDKPDVEVSRNWIQQLCQGATNWEGSAVQALIAGDSGDLPDMDVPDTVAPEEPQEKVIEDDVIDDTPDATEAPSEAPSEPEGTSNVDPLAGLDL